MHTKSVQKAYVKKRTKSVWKKAYKKRTKNILKTYKKRSMKYIFSPLLCIVTHLICFLYAFDMLLKDCFIFTNLYAFHTYFIQKSP